MPTEPASQHLNAEELEIRARAEKATPGPWTQTADEGHIWCIGTGVMVVQGLRGRSRFDDCEFIAAARTDIPLLLERLAAARRELAELRTAAGALDKRLDVLVPHIDGVIGLQSVRSGYDTWTHGSLADEWQALKKLLAAPPAQEHSE